MFNSRTLAFFFGLLAAWGTLSFPVEVAAEEEDETEEQVSIDMEPVGEEDDARLLVEEVVVSGRESTGQGVSIQRIRREDIERSGAEDAAQILERQAAIHATTGSRGERIFEMRGFDQRQTLVLIDGVPSYIPNDGQVDLSMFPAETIERITVIKGPGSVMYGPNGLGGAVNIVTRRPEKGVSFSHFTEVGGVGSRKQTASLNLGEDRIAFSFTAGHFAREGFALASGFPGGRNDSGGVRLNSDKSTTFALAKAVMDPHERHRLSLSASVLFGEKGVPPSLDEREPNYWRFNAWRALGTSLSHSGSLPGGIEIDDVLYLRRFENLLDAYDDATYTTQDSPKAFHSWLHDTIAGARVRIFKTFQEVGAGDLSLRLWTSVQRDGHSKRSDTGRDRVTFSRWLLTAAPEIEYGDGSTGSLLAALQIDADIPESTGDVSLDPQTSWGPLLRGSWHPLDVLTVTATAAGRTRFPTLKERFSGVYGNDLPNPDLKPERAWHFGLEIDARPLPWLHVAASGYDAEVSELIDTVNLGNGEVQIQNLGQARLAGAEAMLFMHPVHWFTMQASYAFLHGRLTDRDPPDDRLEYKQEHKATLELTGGFHPRLSWTHNLCLTGPQKYKNPDTQRWATLGAFFTWNQRLEYRWNEHVSLWFRTTNLLDSYYQTKYGYPDPGREVWFGMRMHVASP